MAKSGVVIFTVLLTSAHYKFNQRKENLQTTLPLALNLLFKQSTDCFSTMYTNTVK